MPELNPKKLHIHFNDKEKDQNSILPRKYTLTHSDITGDLFLSIGPEYDYRKFSNLYSRLLRDEILGEWQNVGQIRLNVHCHSSGGIALGPANWRDSIFRHYMPIVLKALCYGDISFLRKNRDFQKAPIYVYFHARKRIPDRIEKWGIVSDFMPESISKSFF